MADMDNDDDGNGKHQVDFSNIWIITKLIYIYTIIYTLMT